ncbi:ion transporter [Apilactobacillus micheneri]|uniref:potassium channel family protein n=1 Tax=Apilactobacillus micheneri TaxID=1899430 RepID=UPI001129BE1B|nr:potassium channel family protein [Apilactobacillus micheneri]TPR50495.1 ion transporter [Apilactobacillus micheneri]
MKKEIIYKVYIIIMSLLALISIALFALDFSNKIQIINNPWNYIDKSILIIFTIDYFTRLILAKNKWLFFKHNIFDLLAIIPFDNIFSIFRISRISRLFKILKIVRMIRFVGVVGKFWNHAKTFLKTNSLIWALAVGATLILVSSMLYSLTENINFGDAVWWSITTTTTVGYGDISPKTALGKFAAVLLMFTGIGIIGILTSAITSYFQNDKKEDKTELIIKELEKIREENKKLNDKIDKIKK